MSLLCCAVSKERKRRGRAKVETFDAALVVIVAAYQYSGSVPTQFQFAVGTMSSSIQSSYSEYVEYYPRQKRAPYLMRRNQGKSNGGEVGWDLLMTESDFDGRNPAGSSLKPIKFKSSPNLAVHPTDSMRRRSSFARMLSSFGLIDEGVETDNNLLGPGADFEAPETPLRRRKASASDQRRSSIDQSMRDFGGVAGQPAVIDGALDITSIPKWARHDPNVIVMKDGKPVTVGTLIYHHKLLSDDGINSGAGNQYTITPTWRIRERMKTVGVCLVLALNIGTDPPDLVKPTPCAKLQCWLDPTSISRLKAKERIGERLEQQYAKWQQRSKLKYRRALDPTVSAVKDLCLRMRESAKNERVLFHFNGQGTPRPTANGEIWLFDKHHTNYIPLSVCDLRRWIGKPSIVVLDCSGAGVLMPYFTQPLLEDNTGGYEGTNAPYNRSSSAITEEPDSGGAEFLKSIRDTIVLCPTAQGEWLPLNYPELPADLFTSCLTTPIQIALRWFVFKNPLSTQGLDIETVADSIPGKLTDRKTPLGELNWIFTAITDTIAFNVLPSQLFMRLFRQDLLLASLFRNFLLAERILRTLGCTPMTYPELPSTYNHVSHFVEASA